MFRSLLLRQGKSLLQSPVSRRLLASSISVGGVQRIGSFFSTEAAKVPSTSNNNKPPFDRLLIANRGEIAERVIRTCQDLNVETVAVYSTADAQARFVQQATHAVCLGPPAASESYLNSDLVLQVLQETESQALHPGYGFLSENAEFCQQVTDQGVVWLGPPPYAVTEMGDKLASKQIAMKANVNVIPGYEDPLENVDQALQVANDIVGYPVLLKAAAGGGGKGMRICHSPQELKESYDLAKAEARKFFKDDRVLLEKYIVQPHHIEFQVLCDREAKTVVVFPERECSIQRRNQKIIEETPSTLLTEETRSKMTQQVIRLCQAVGYESAGTVEFLVDEDQNFYFLEMNTRLQVEHPISEAIGHVDLVKGMLYVGANWGLPEEFGNVAQSFDGGYRLAHCGHAVEARIYAEDPLRGFLPSTGPLSTYVEPLLTRNTIDHYIRMDSGVCAGHVVSPHYDPMISKVVSYAQDRSQAIAGLQQALDEYVIQGVQHNARLVQSVLRHPSFLEGDTPTNFLPLHYGSESGFTGVELSAQEESEFVVSAAAIVQARQALLQQPPLATSNGFNEAVIVKLGGLFGKAFRILFKGDGKEATVTPLGNDSTAAATTVKLDSLEYLPVRHAANVSLDGTMRTIQVLHEKTSGEIEMQMYGYNDTILVQSEREHELSQYMHEPVIPDTANLVQSPMPGTLISYAIKEGDKVQDGQELCVVEAMKMQNIIRSHRDGVIGSCKVEVGASLRADEVILEFSDE